MGGVAVTAMQKTAGKLESRRITVNGLSLRYRLTVEPEPASETAIVMVHGLVVSNRYMLPTARCLAEHYRIYVPDLPGYGRSAHPRDILDMAELADALADWMTALGLERAVLLGNSMGCQIIAQFVMRHPHRLLHAILVSPTMDPRARTAHQEIGRWLVNIIFEPPSLYPIVMRDFLDVGLRRFTGTFRRALRDHIEEHLPHLNVPTLVVRGSRDTVVPQRWAEEVTRLLPQGRLVVVPKAAHDVNYNSPQALADVVCSFLAEQDVAMGEDTNSSSVK